MSGCCTGSDEDAWHNQDFLPLPMSESYKLPSRKNRTRPEDPEHRKVMLSHDKPGRWAHDKHAEDDPEDDPTRPDLRQQPGRVKQALLDTGLDSTDDEGDEGEKDEQERQQQQQRKKKKSHGGQVDDKGWNEQSGAARQQDQGQGPSGNNPFGALVRGKAPEAKSSNPNRSASPTMP